MAGRLGLALTQAGAHRGAEQRHLARVVLGCALDQPSPPQVADEATWAPRRRKPVVVGADHDLDVEPLRGSPEGRGRVLAGRSPVQVVVVEHVELAGHRPTRQVPPPGGGCREPRGWKERVSRRQPARRRMHDDRDLARRLIEPLFEAQPKVLQRVERSLGAVGVLGFVAGDEAERLCLDPRHPSTRLDHPSAAGRPRVCRTSGGCGMLDAKRKPPRGARRPPMSRRASSSLLTARRM